jgi:hypothetical protein
MKTLTKKIEVVVAFGMITLLVGVVIFNVIVYGTSSAPW